MGKILTRYRLIIFSGIATFVLLLSTIAMGIVLATSKAASENMVKVHASLATTTLVFALVHISPTVYNKIKMARRRRAK